MDKPILDPSIPYVGPIYGGRFAPGKLVRIQGTSPGVAYRFNINLQCGSETVPRDDVAVQVAVRFLDGYISLNSSQNGNWGEEHLGAALPIKRAEQFEIIITCDFSQYKIAVNGQHYCEFPQRIHYDRITHLAIDGDVSIVRITYESTSPGGFGVASSSGIGVTSGGGMRAPATASLFPGESEHDDFELIDSTHSTRPPPPGLQSARNVGFAELPSYESATSGNQAGLPFKTTAGAPYPIGGAPYPTGGAPYPTGGAPYPTGGAMYPTGSNSYPSGGAPYPTPGAPYPAGGAPYPHVTSAPYPGVGVPNATPYPTGVPGVMGTSPYPPPGAPGIPPPPLGAPVPLNAASSNFHVAKRTTGQRCWKYFCGILIGFIIIVAVVLSKVFRHRSRYTSHTTSHSYGSSNNNYGNNYNNYGSNSYGGYNSNNYYHRD